MLLLLRHAEVAVGQGHAAQQALRWPTGLVNVPPGQSAFPGPDQYAALGQPERNLGFLGTLRRGHCRVPQWMRSTARPQDPAGFPDRP